MSHYTTVSIPKDIKKRASYQAKKDNLPFSTVVKILLKDYVDGLITIGTRRPITPNGFTPEEENEILKASTQAQEGINVQSFENVDSFFKDLDK